MKVLEKTPNLKPLKNREGQPEETEQETLARRLANIKDLRKKVAEQPINVATPDYLEKPSEIPAKTDENLTRLDPQTRTIIEDLIKRRETLINYTQIHGRHAAASVKDAEEIAKIDSKLVKWGIVLRPKKAS